MGRKMDKIQKLTISCIVFISFSSAIFTDELKDIINSKKDSFEEIAIDILKGIKKYREIRKKLSNYKKFVKDNFEYVGENFTYKARSIHYDKKKPKKGIYGSASLKDVKELKEEGIETDIIPWIDDDKN